MQTVRCSVYTSNKGFGTAELLFSFPCLYLCANPGPRFQRRPTGGKGAACFQEAGIKVKESIDHTAVCSQGPAVIHYHALRSVSRALQFL